MGKATELIMFRETLAAVAVSTDSGTWRADWQKVPLTIGVSGQTSVFGKPKHFSDPEGLVPGSERSDLRLRN